MFPEGLTHFADASASGLVSGLKWAYKASRTVSWIVCTSASIMFLPIMIETERMGIEEAQKQQQRQILLGNFRFWFAPKYSIFEIKGQNASIAKSLPLLCSFLQFLLLLQFFFDTTVSNLNNYFDFHVCLSFPCPSIRLKNNSNSCSSITK